MLADERDELDHILNQALSAYRAEPMLGIEARIIRRVRSEGHPTQRTAVAASFWGRAIGIGLTVAVVAAGVFLSRNHGEKPAKPKQTIAERPSNRVDAAVEATPPAGVNRDNRDIEGSIKVRSRRSALPKLDVFPTPRSLTAQELALVKMASAVSPKATAQSEKTDTAQLEPIQIEALAIKPLLIGGDEEGDKKER
jgi:hypothetical protein